MNCEECLLVLDEYVEGELDERQAGPIAAHIDFCLSCAEHYEELKREQEMYLRYFMSAEASPALWAGVQAGVEEIQRHRASAYQRFRQRLAVAFGVSSFNPAHVAVPLALLITLGIILGVMKYQIGGDDRPSENAARNGDLTQIKNLPEKHLVPDDTIISDVEKDTGRPIRKIVNNRSENRGKKNRRRPDSSERANQKNNSAEASRQLTTEAVIEKTERQYLNAIAILSRDALRRRKELSADTAAQLEKSLAEIDQTINATRRAVREQPGDAVAVQYMTAAYAKKIELLRDITNY
jgi:hypothetical protein